jgi:hypothetical protein
MDRREFAHPGTAYRGVALWMLNDELEPDEIARQLDGLYQAGWGALITRTFFGLRTPYLGEEWMQILEQIVTRAAQHDLKVWLQAGYMPGAIPNLDPALAHRTLTRKGRADALEGNERVLAEDEGYRYVEQTLPHVLDLLNPAAVDGYLEGAYEAPWLARFGLEFGRTIEAVWVDEPHFRPPLLPWSEALPARFQARWGYDLAGQLPSLFAPLGDYRAVRHHYWRVVNEMLQEAYFARVGAWCEAHGVRFSGHLMGEDTLNNQVAWTGAAMPCYEYMHVPGIDHLTMSVYWPSGKKFILAPKQCSSAAHQLGREWILSEMYGVSSQGITFEDRKQIAEWLAVLGVNYRCYHGSFYSLRGRRKRYYPPHLSHQQPWWPENGRIAAYFARLSYALRQGEHQADVLVLHPVESAFCLYDTLAMTQPHDRTREPEQVQALDTHLVDLCDDLLSIQRSFDLGDETLLARHGEVTEAGLRVGRVTYTTVILPELITLRQSTLDLLAAFAAAGGTIVATGALPQRVDGVRSDRAQALDAIVERVPNERAPLRATLDAAHSPDVELVAAAGSDVSGVWLHPRRVEEGRLLYLHNTNREAAVTADLRIRGTGRLERWDLESGAAAEVPAALEDGCTVARLSFAPLGSHLLLLREAERPSRAAARPARVRREVSVLQRPRVARRDPNTLTLDTCRCRKGEGEWSEVLPVLTLYEQLARESYEGPVTLQFIFEVGDVPSSLRVVIEDADRYEIAVNGQPVRYAGLPYWIDRSFHPVDVTGLVQRGTNVVELATDFRAVPQPRFVLAGLFEKLEGVELESIYLIGDFAVTGQLSPAEPRPRCLRFSPGFRIAAEQQTAAGDLVSAGYPFYVGRIALSEIVSLEAPQEGERAVLELPAIDAAALVVVRVNGREAGAIMWPPYEIDVTSLVKEGENEIEVELVSTLRNLLGPHHRPAGEPDQCWGTDYTLYPEWLEDETLLRAHWTDDYFFLNLGIGPGARIRYVSGG